MAVQRGVHPSADILKAFGLGKLDDSSSGVVLDHLDQCEDCRKQVTSLSGDDFLNRLRQARGRSFTPAPARPLGKSAAGPNPPVRQPATANLPPELANNPQYEILRELGRGGMGVVYLAKNKLMDRLEVLKVVNKALLDHPGAVERFLREIRSAAKLSHANVVAAYHALQDGELLAFAMEYIEGQDLASLVKSQGPLPIVHACYYVQQAALGLQHAFEKGRVHRDIKPQNLILARQGKKHIVKVLDFGLAKATREKKDDTGLTGEGKMLGTPDYIAPEQTLDAARANIRSDIYSLGCTLYYLLSGRPPFSANNLAAMALAHQTHEAKPLNLVRPEVPEELAAVVRKMMAKSPAKRYQTPLDVVQALAPFVKLRSKQDEKSVSAPAADVRSPRRGTVIAANTGEIQKILREVPGKKPPKAASPKDEAVSPFADLTDTDSASKNIVRVSEAAKSYRTPWWKRPGVLAVAFGVSLALFLMAVIIIKVRTPEGTIVLEDLPEDADVTVDGRRVTVKLVDGKTVEISVTASKKHKLEVKIGDNTIFVQEMEIDASERRPIHVGFQPPVPPPNNPPPRDPKRAPADNGFVPLFNGKNLNGWKVFDGGTGNWKVVDGIIVGSGPMSHLFSERGNYENFHYRVEAMINDGGNSGQYFRTEFGPGFPKGYEAQINSTHGDHIRTGSLYPSFGTLLNEERDKIIVKNQLVKPNEWFIQEVIADGNHIIIKVKDKTTVDFVDHKNTYKKGHFALQQHNPGSVVKFRKIAIKEMPSLRQRRINLPADASVDDLRQALKSEDPAVLEIAAARLANLGAEAKPAMYALAETLTSAKTPTSVRRNAALAIAHIGAAAKPIAPALAEVLDSSEPVEVRQFAAEALAQMRYPANEAALSAILKSIEKDSDPLVRQKCVWALFALNSVEKIREIGADKALEKLLDETGDQTANLRYDAARKLANALHEGAPDKTADVLLEMLTDARLKVYGGTDVKVEGGRTNPQPNVGGDARFTAAMALGWLGDKAAKRSDVVESLRKAAKDKDEKLKAAAQDAMKALNIKE